jgi:ribosome biogenesis GTPase
LREKNSRTTNPVAVGDNVQFEFERSKATGVISSILARRNYILRKASNLSKESQIIAANIDLLFLMVTIVLPETSFEFIDRLLITAEAYGIPAVILINKIDIYNESEKKRMKYLDSLYNKVGYECIMLSVKDDKGVAFVKERMKDKVSLVAGNSGVGKTTLINKLNPLLNLKTESVSDYHKQGKHITTFPEMHPLPFGGYVIDSPGLRGFGVIDMDRNEIFHFFPEIFRTSKDCRFYNCLHLNEPGCAVREAVEKKMIDPQRYRSYVNILEDNNRKYR